MWSGNICPPQADKPKKLFTTSRFVYLWDETSLLVATSSLLVKFKFVKKGVRLGTKHIFVLGGVLSSLGKGVAAASIGLLLKKMGYRVNMQKLDPYLNVDPGTMSPYQHGEVFVTEDGAETDLDLGHYERFIDESLSQRSNATSGRVYERVLSKERRGEYLGKTVQVIPHITDEIKKLIYDARQDYDIVITEIGGTIGDIESFQFLEAIRQFTLQEKSQDCMVILLTYIPFIKAAGELKTKPTQHAAVKLRELGLHPDMLFCRSELPFSQEITEKIALFTNVRASHVINAIDVNSIYKCPANFMSQAVHTLICDRLQLQSKKIDFSDWQAMIDAIDNPQDQVSVAVCGKYVEHQDAYKSIVEAFIHAGAFNGVKVKIKWIDTRKLQSKAEIDKALEDVSGVLIPGGFDKKGSEGKLFATRYAREHKLPFFGICLGMQVASIEFARNVCNLSDATSTEFEQKTKNPIIHIMEDKKYLENYGGTLRLGAYDCVLSEGSLAKKIYGKAKIKARHRHRYEFNNAYRKLLQEAGLSISGLSPDQMLVEIVEIADHPFFIGVQYHPEFQSRPTRPEPIFREFVAAVMTHHAQKIDKGLLCQNLTT